MAHTMGLGAGSEQPFEDSGPRSGPPDALVLDIGGEIGALIIYAEESCLGREIDLTPVGSPRSHHIHTMIRRRRATDKDVIAGLYPELQEGNYTVWGLGHGERLGEVTIVGGQVSEFHGGHCRAPQEPGAEPEAEMGHEPHEHSHGDGHPHVH